MRVLVVNPGSSSLKVSLVADAVAQEDDGGPYDGIGVRFVHGGSRTSPARLDPAVLDELEDVSALAPLHNPPALEAARDLLAAHPGVPVVACFDTTFHTTIPDAAATYALPREWNRRWGLRRYGFHGLSHAYAARRAAELVGRPAEELRIVTCHLGGGASLCAVRGGRSVDTTMGMTPMEGLVMQTRSGSVDPGLLLHLLTREGLDPDELERGLDREAGLKGLSGTSGDLREVQAAIAAGDADARLALDVYVHRLVREVGAMTASAGGLDVLVFTGGVGEHAPEVRAAVASALGHLGVTVDARRNERSDDEPDVEISAEGSAVRTLVVQAREDLEIAREVRGLL
ncbi:acetate/propionate family kinase [Nocardioides mangrovi]|uniref:Acetate kinase n=1 Tax=Nocardioides mangrovi TaxID=2874580 RepID=A0ABS7UGK4_9ACTN|nr:acetate/propionate family kinase [Nocardioides mangrovi]MBZ5740140.1 acetate/propionate family kinase [Nocardioides mangrovi]